MSINSRPAVLRPWCPPSLTRIPSTKCTKVSLLKNSVHRRGDDEQGSDIRRGRVYTVTAVQCRVLFYTSRVVIFGVVGYLLCTAVQCRVLFNTQAQCGLLSSGRRGQTSGVIV